MKKFEKPFFISLLLSCIPLLLYFMCYPLLPTQIPSNFDFSGEVTGYTSRGSYLFLTLLPFFMTIVFAVAPNLDPKMENYNKFSSFYGKFQVFMVVFMDIVISLTMLQCIFDNVPSVSKVIPLLLGCLFLFIGNYLPKTKQMFTFGIKTPWTLSSEIVWYKTHRIAGYSFVFAGICSFLSMLLPSRLTGYLMMFGILVAVLIPAAMSYVFFKQEEK